MGADGSSAGWFIPFLARHKFPSRASDTFIVLARGVDIIARDYVKVDRRSTRRRELARARSENAGILGSRCKSRVRLAHDLCIREPGAALGSRDEALPGRPSKNNWPRPDPSAAWGGRHPSTTGRPPGWAGVVNPDARVPEDRNRGSGFRSEATPPYGKHPTRGRRARGLPHPLSSAASRVTAGLPSQRGRDEIFDQGKQGVGRRGTRSSLLSTAGGGLISIPSHDPDVEAPMIRSPTEETPPSPKAPNSKQKLRLTPRNL